MLNQKIIKRGGVNLRETTKTSSGTRRLRNWTAEKSLLALIVPLGIIGIVCCSYGYAATNTTLSISGEATIQTTNEFNITYMQEMTTSICARAADGATQRLIDKRDGKKYWVAKLADGKCWMVQNLALNLTTSGLTSELSDIVTGYGYTTSGKYIVWGPSATYPPRDTTIDKAYNASDSATYDVLVNSAGFTKDWIIAEPEVSYAAQKTTSLSSFGPILKDVTGWQPTYTYDPKVSRYSYNATNRTYDAHYLVGNYYSYAAATASSTKNVKSTAATSSICPQGWTLPTGRLAAGSTSASTNDFMTLFAAYNIGTSASFTYNKVAYNIAGAPLYMARFGGVAQGAEYNAVGYQTHFWVGFSTYATDGRKKYTAALVGDAVDNKALVNGYLGRVIRCVAR